MTEPAAIPTVFVGIESDERGNESPEHQVKTIREHPPATADGRFNVGEFSESGHSGFKKERGPELQAAIAKAKEAASEYGEAELWVFHSSRLARGDGKKGQRSLMKLWSDLYYEDVQVRSVKDDEFVVNPMLVGVASTQNSKYSQDLSDHVSRGKRAQWDKGRRLGGKVPDGYLAERKRDSGGRIIRIDYRFDPERQPTYDRLFSLALGGTPDTATARTLNQEGFRTGTGKPWTRRGVQDKVTNPFYAGLISRNRYTDGPLETREGEGEHPGYLSPEDLQKMIAERAKRDRGAGKHKGGAPAKAHLLDGGEDGLLRCLKCGGPMFSVNSKYVRKSDGCRKRSYMCRHVKTGTGLCDAPMVDSSRVDGALLDSLDGMFIDFDGWLNGLREDTDSSRKALQADLERQKHIAARAQRKEEDLARRYAEHVGSDEVLANADALAMKQQAEKRQDAESRVKHLQKALDHADQPEPVDHALDLYNSISASIKGALGKSRLSEVRDGLRKVFARFFIGLNEDGDIEILPQLREDLIGDLDIVERADGASLTEVMTAEIEGETVTFPLLDVPGQYRNPTPIPVLVPKDAPDPNLSNSQE